jgi:hypothetical protein
MNYSLARFGENRLLKGSFRALYAVNRIIT